MPFIFKMNQKLAEIYQKFYKKFKRRPKFKQNLNQILVLVLSWWIATIWPWDTWDDVTGLIVAIDYRGLSWLSFLLVFTRYCCNIIKVEIIITPVWLRSFWHRKLKIICQGFITIRLVSIVIFKLQTSSTMCCTIRIIILLFFSHFFVSNGTTITYI